jgi:hypothetical protein
MIIYRVAIYNSDVTAPGERGTGTVWLRLARDGVSLFLAVVPGALRFAAMRSSVGRLSQNDRSCCGEESRNSRFAMTFLITVPVYHSEDKIKPFSSLNPNP